VPGETEQAELKSLRDGQMRLVKQLEAQVRSANNGSRQDRIARQLKTLTQHVRDIELVIEAISLQR
jgi:hypothetical protein